MGEVTRVVRLRHEQDGTAASLEVHDPVEALPTTKIGGNASSIMGGSVPQITVP